MAKKEEVVMRFISPQFPNLSYGVHKFIDGVFETTDADVAKELLACPLVSFVNSVEGAGKPEETMVDAMDRKEIISKLKELGVEYTVTMKTEVLATILKENI